MKKFYYLLTMLLLPVLSYGLYDDFSGYEKHYEVIDNCMSLAPHSVSWTVVNTTGATNLTIGTGATTITSLQFDKSNKGNDFSIHGNCIYPAVTTNQRDISGINDGYVTCLLSVPTISGSISQVKIELTSYTIVTTVNKVIGTTTVTINSPTTGFNYLKSLALTGATLDYSSIQSASVNMTAASSTTFSGAQISDIRVISKDNTTGGAWNQGSGIWEIFKINSDTQYFQIDTAGTNITTPQLFTKVQYKDFIYSAKIKVVNTTNSYNEAGIIFRYLFGTSYSFVVDKSGTDPVLKLKKNNTDTSTATITGTSVFDVDSTGPTALTGNSFWLKAEVKGDSIKTYYATNTTPLTWNQVFNYSDSNPIQYGNVGVNCDKQYIVDNVEVLPAPTSPAASGGDNTVKLTWTKDYSYSGEIAGYNVYKTTTPGVYGATPAYTLTGTIQEDNSVVNGTSYYYKITSVISSKTSTGTVTTSEFPMSLVPEINANPHPGIQVANGAFMPNSSNAAINKVKFTVYNPSGAATELKVYQPTGVLIKTIPGSGSTIDWDGTNSNGSIVEGGIYMWQIRMDNSVAGSGTMVVAK